MSCIFTGNLYIDMDIDMDMDVYVHIYIEITMEKITPLKN